jgi:DNA polymerase-3 subunit gamma/tau
MAYTALARKYRPKKFTELIGQDHDVRALTNALESGRVHHAFLFTGTRGVGKTTIARIFAKCLNCVRAEESKQEVTADPCGVCPACTEIDAGRFVDLIEVDAASRTKVDDTRELLDNVQYAPTRARYKVYLIDEVHMLSAHSFNALLKTLEEPPPHVKFLFATTDPQKLPVTVLSRCLQFNLKRLPVTQIAELMKQILTKESVPFDAGGVRLVAQAADGSMRDGLSLLDQLIAFGGGKVDEESTRAMLGTIARDHVEKLGELLAAGDAAALLQYAKSLEQWSPDYAQVLDELASLLVRVATKQAVSDYESEELFAPELIDKLASAMSPEDAQLYYQTAITGRRDLHMAPEPRIGFEMTLLRMLVFRPSADTYATPSATGSAPAAPRVSAAAQARAAAAGGAGGTRASETGGAGGTRAGEMGGASGTRAGAGSGGRAGDGASASGSAARSGDMLGSARRADDGAARYGSRTDSSAVAGERRAAASPAAAGGRGETAASQAGTANGARGAAANGGDRNAPGPGSGGNGHGAPGAGVEVTPASWGSILAQLDLAGLARQLANNCMLIGRSGALVRLGLDPRNNMMRVPGAVDKLTQALSKYFGEPVRIEFEAPVAGAETPAQAVKRAVAEEFDSARQSLESDPAVRALRETFGATLHPDSVRPLK